jgi:hypothetical protein
LRAETSADPAGLTARATLEARPETRAANLRKTRTLSVGGRSLLVTWSGNYHRFMTRKPNKRHAAPQYQEPEQPPPGDPLDESGQEKPKRPRWRSILHMVGRGAGAVADTIVEAPPL